MHTMAIHRTGAARRGPSMIRLDSPRIDAREQVTFQKGQIHPRGSVARNGDLRSAPLLAQQMDSAASLRDTNQQHGELSGLVHAVVPQEPDLATCAIETGTPS